MYRVFYRAGKLKMMRKMREVCFAVVQITNGWTLSATSLQRLVGIR